MFAFYFDGHNYEYESRNALRIFDLNIDIEIKDRKDFVNNKNLGLISCLSYCDESDERIVSTAKLYDGNKLLFESSFSNKDVHIEKDSDTKLKKVLVVKSIHCVLLKYYRIKPQYGILTGVRPVKILCACKNGNKTEKEIYEIMSDTYEVNDDKIKLLTDVLSVEEKYINKDINKANYNLYIGIPFCPSKCSYCSFTSYVNCKEDKIDKYLDILIYEISQTIELAIRNNLKLNTLYIGGGTPSALNENQIKKIFDTIKKYYDMSEIEEVTFEAGRPDTITESKLEFLRNNQVGRISINPQTMNKSTLESIGRKHSVENIIDKYNLARKVGFDSINMDMILGLPGECETDVCVTIGEILKLRPENITVHALAYKRGSAFSLEQQHIKTRDYELLQNMHDIADKACIKAGYKPYYMYRQKNIKGNLENIGYTLKDKENIYNIVIIEEIETILACGAGASSKILMGDDRHESIHNFKSLEDYEKRINEIIDQKRKLLNYRKF